MYHFFFGFEVQNVLDPGIEPGTYCVLGSRHNQLDQPSKANNPGGTRTLSLEIRSLTPYPVGPQGLHMKLATNGI